MELSPGDKIVFRENQKGIDRIRNGESAIINRIENGQAVARLDSGKEITLDQTTGQTVDYGWCRTIHASQGATVDHVLIAGEASRVATAQTAYVAASRERDTLKIYTDNPTALEKHWARFAEREQAVSAKKDRSAPNFESLKELREQARADLGHHGDLSRAREELRPTPPPSPAPEWEMER
jgi:ATP-dependent exoDNAse (exonuclease V) alpha subunit